MWKTNGVINGSVGVSTPFLLYVKTVCIYNLNWWLSGWNQYLWLVPLNSSSDKTNDFGIKRLMGTFFQNILLSLRGKFQGLGELRWNCSQLKCKGIGPLTWFLLQTVVPCQQGQSRWSRQGKVGVHVATMFWCKLFVYPFFLLLAIAFYTLSIYPLSMVDP